MVFTFILRTTGITRAVFLMIPIILVLYSTTAFSEEDLVVSPEAEAALEEDIKGG